MPHLFDSLGSSAATARQHTIGFEDLITLYGYLSLVNEFALKVAHEKDELPETAFDGATAFSWGFTGRPIST